MSSAVFPNQLLNNNTGSQLIDVTMTVNKSCPAVPPVIVTYFQNSPIGWNAVVRWKKNKQISSIYRCVFFCSLFLQLVGLLSSILAIIFLLTCLYYFLCRRRYNHLSELPTPVPLVEKNGGIPVANSSQTATTTFINEPGKETKVTTYTEQSKISATHTGLVNGHTVSNGLVANGNADPSELRLLQHEHH